MSDSPECSRGRHDWGKPHRAAAYSRAEKRFTKFVTKRQCNHGCGWVRVVSACNVNYIDPTVTFHRSSEG